MSDRTYRVVSCSECLWQDYYACDGTRPSYPPRCPECGESCMPHEFITANWSASVRRALGRDQGVRAIFGDPNSDYRNYAERRFGSSWMKQSRKWD
jgi:hypothetical protein